MLFWERSRVSDRLQKLWDFSEVAVSIDVGISTKFYDNAIESN